VARVMIRKIWFLRLAYVQVRVRLSDRILIRTRVGTWLRRGLGGSSGPAVAYCEGLPTFRTTG